MLEHLSEHKIGTAAEIEGYWNNMEQEGHKDFEFFQMMSKDNVKQMMADIRRTKSAHKVKLITAWEKLKSTDELVTSLQEEQATESPAVMPPEVANLLFQNPINIMMEMINSDVEELFKESYGLFEQTNDFVQYVKGQRQKRYRYHKIF